MIKWWKKTCTCCCCQSIPEDSAEAIDKDNKDDSSREKTFCPNTQFVATGTSLQIPSSEYAEQAKATEKRRLKSSNVIDSSTQ